MYNIEEYKQINKSNKLLSKIKEDFKDKENI